MRSKSMLALLLACATLPGCRQGAEIKVEQNAGGTRFTVERPGGEPACIRALSVYEGTPNGGPPMWNLAAGDDAPCTSTVEFPKVPKGFSQDDDTPMLKLKHQQSYHVEASGDDGWTAFQAFTSK